MMEGEKAFIVQVTCNKEGCFQFVTKEFYESHKSLDGFEMMILGKSGKFNIKKKTET